MEGKLKTQDSNKPKNTNESDPHGLTETVFENGEPMRTGMQRLLPAPSYDSMPTNDSPMLPITNVAPEMMQDSEFIPNMDFNLDPNFSWEMIGLGLEEPMPTQEAVDELYDSSPSRIRIR